MQRTVARQGPWKYAGANAARETITPTSRAACSGPHACQVPDPPSICRCWRVNAWLTGNRVMNLNSSMTSHEPPLRAAPYGRHAIASFFEIAAVEAPLNALRRAQSRMDHAGAAAMPYAPRVRYPPASTGLSWKAAPDSNLALQATIYRFYMNMGSPVGGIPVQARACCVVYGHGVATSPSVRHR